MANSREHRAIRERLFAEDPLCHWCLRTTELPPAEGRLEGWHATLDHLFPRSHPLRAVSTPGIERYVLACERCNRERGHKQREWPKNRILAPQLGMWALE